VSNLHVYIAMKGFLLLIVVVNYVIWKKLEGHLHVFILIKSCFEIHVFDVVQIIDEVATNSDPNLIWDVFCGAVVNDNSCMCDSFIF
jgi:hypothetical protein